MEGSITSNLGQDHKQLRAGSRATKDRCQAPRLRSSLVITHCHIQTWKSSWARCQLKESWSPKD